MKRPIVAVVGGGEAGTTAAASAVQFGLDVLLFDQFDTSSPLDSLAEPSPNIPNDGAQTGQLTVLNHASVWGLFPGWTVAASRFGEPTVQRVDAVLLATGAIDRAVPFAGSSRPGVITASGLARLIDVHRLLPGQRFVVIGEGPDARDAAERITDEGGEVVLQVPEDEARSMTAFGPSGIHTVIVSGTTIRADIVVMAAGRMPDIQLVAMAECDLVFDDKQQAWKIWRDELLRTSAAGLWAAGDVAGCASVPVALAEGRFAAAAMAHQLGTIDDIRFEQARREYAGSGHACGKQSGATVMSIRQPWRPELALTRHAED